MDIKLRKILEDVQYNMIHGYYPNKTLRKYYIHDNLKFIIDDSIFYYSGDHKYYYFYIWLMVNDI